ncbi:MAG: hypothetical protein C0522_04065 [Rhodocyclaceae bacterium]|jgi:hypothetical protein|nr:hypothetical protein [Rhodocyclaceae bacterium]
MDASRIIARLLAQRVLPRRDQEMLALLTDAGLRQEVEERLAACGLRLLDHPYADYVAIALAKDAEAPVFETDAEWQASNVGLPKDAVALLVLLWALIVLPKRERQISRTDTEGQGEMFGGAARKPDTEVSGGIPETTLLEDYGRLLGGKARVIQFLLPVLSRLGFIERRNKTLFEGPLLDLAFDYAEVAPRILQGALADVVKKRREPA